MIRFNPLHFILTRYNIGLYSEDAIADKAAWMEERLQLFEAHYLPSLAAQAPAIPFQVLLWIDPVTPEAEFNEIRRAVFRHDIPAEFHFKDPREALTAMLPAYRLAGYSHLLTSRLDNDDAFKEGALQAIQDAARRFFETVRLNDGDEVSDNLIFIIDVLAERLHRDGSREPWKRAKPNGPFLSLCEPIAQGKTRFITAWCGEHSKANKRFPAIFASLDRPYAVHTVHGTNAYRLRVRFQESGTPWGIAKLKEEE